jgi:hypothetical protein
MPTHNQDAEAIYQNYSTHKAQRKYDYARSLLRRAAEMGHPKAMYDCGMDYMSGDGFPQDNKQAIHWIRKAAEKGHADAQFHLGVIYRKEVVPGLPGVFQDLPEAYKWFKLAAQQRGNENVLGQHGLDKLLPTMSSEQLQEGERRYREFQLKK